MSGVVEVVAWVRGVDDVKHDALLLRVLDDVVHWHEQVLEMVPVAWQWMQMQSLVLQLVFH